MKGSKKILKRSKKNAEGKGTPQGHRINEEIMLIAWRSRRWWDFWMSEDEKKEIEPILTE